MNINVIKVGNSKGIRLPKTILKEYNIGETVELILKPDHIEIRSKNQPRESCDIKFIEMSQYNNEESLIPDVFEDE